MWWREESRNTSYLVGVLDLPETYGLYRRGKTTPVLRPLQTSAEKNEQDKTNVVKGWLLKKRDKVGWLYHSYLPLLAPVSAAGAVVHLAQTLSSGELLCLHRPVVKREEPGHLPHSVHSLLWCKAHSLVHRGFSVLYVVWLSLVLAELKGWPLWGALMLFTTYVLQLWWASFWGCTLSSESDGTHTWLFSY